MRSRWWCLALAACILATAVHAQDAVTIYRCTDAAGNVTVQNDRPCPAGTTQSKRTLGGVPSAASPTAVPIPARVLPLTPATAATPAAASAPASAGESPMPAVPFTMPGVLPAAPPPLPPALYECRAPGGGVRWADAADPFERCATLLATGGACDVDTSVSCVAVPDAQRCERWARRLQDLQQAGGLDAGLPLHAEIARAEAVLSGPTCSPAR